MSRAAELRGLRVTGPAEAQLLMRVLNIFAQRDLVPDRLASRVEDGTIIIEVASSAFDALQWERIAVRLASLPLAGNVAICDLRFGGVHEPTS